MCKHKNGDITYMFGHEVSPCVYEDLEKYCNVTVTISRCKYCGELDISWERQENTEQIEM